MTEYHLAQINIARFRTPQDDPANAEFISNLDRINALAESQPGFVWRLVGDGGDAMDIRAFDDPRMAINMSVWRDLDSLGGFVYRTAHREIMRRRREWFDPMEPFMALWWTPAGHRPSPAEGKARLELLGRLGPTAEAFTFKTPFPAPGRPTVSPVLDECA